MFSEFGQRADFSQWRPHVFYCFSKSDPRLRGDDEYEEVVLLG